MPQQTSSRPSRLLAEVVSFSLPKQRQTALPLIRKIALSIPRAATNSLPRTLMIYIHSTFFRQLRRMVTLRRALLATKSSRAITLAVRVMNLPFAMDILLSVLLMFSARTLTGMGMSIVNRSLCDSSNHGLGKIAAHGPCLAGLKSVRRCLVRRRDTYKIGILLFLGLQDTVLGFSFRCSGNFLQVSFYSRLYFISSFLFVLCLTPTLYRQHQLASLHVQSYNSAQRQITQCVYLIPRDLLCPLKLEL